MRKGPGKMQTLAQLQIMVLLNKGKFIPRRTCIRKLNWADTRFDNTILRLIRLGMVEKSKDVATDQWLVSSHYKLTKQGEEWLEIFMDKLMEL